MHPPAQRFYGCDRLGGAIPETVSLTIQPELSLTVNALGLPLAVHTHSVVVANAVRTGWSAGTAESDQPGWTLEIVVVPGDPATERPAFEFLPSRLELRAGDTNFGWADLESRRAHLTVSAGTAAAIETFRWFYLDALVCTMLAQCEVTPLHAACVSREGHGVLLCGPSGVGKSTLSLASAAAGWDLVAEDATYAVNRGPAGLVRGRPGAVRLRPDALRFFPAIAGDRAGVHPNGKATVQVEVERLGIRTADATHIRAVVMLRRTTGEAGIRQADPHEAAAGLLDAIPNFGSEARAVHERTIGKLVEGGAWELRYDAPADGVDLLARLLEQSDA